MYDKYAEIRDKLHLTDFKVSQGAGVSRSTLSEWKNGKHVPNVENLKKIADYLGVPLDSFYGTSETPYPAHIKDFVERLYKLPPKYQNAVIEALSYQEYLYEKDTKNGSGSLKEA